MKISSDEYATKNNPCPICNSGIGWCFHKTNSEGKILYFCHHINPPCGTKINGYECVKNCTSTGVFVPEENIYAGKTNGWKNHSDKKYGAARKAYEIARKTEDEKRANVIADVETRNKTYGELLRLLQIENKDREYLLSEGWDDEMIRKHRIVSLPPNDAERLEGCNSKNPFRIRICEELIKRGCQLKYVPGFSINKKKKWTIIGKKGIIFPCYDIEGRITQLRLRPNYSAKDLQWYLENKGRPAPKYTFLTSDNENGGARNNVGYSIYLPDEGFTKVCYLIEGEKKSIVVAEKRKTMAVCVQGVNSISPLFEEEMDYDGIKRNLIQKLKKRGVELFVIAYDADKYEKKEVLSALNTLYERMENEGVRFAVADWNPHIAKGIDDLIMLGLNPSYKLV